MNVEDLTEIEAQELLNYENESYGCISEGIAMLLDKQETQEGLEQNCQSIIESLLKKQKQLLRNKIENAILKHTLGSSVLADVVYSVDV